MTDVVTEAAGRRSSDRVIWAMAWPVMLSLMLENASELIDIAMVGHLGGTAVAAVGYGAQLVHLVSSLLQSVAVGCVALMARSIGARQLSAARESLAGSLIVALGVGGLPTVAILVAPRLWLSALGADPAVMNLTVPYLRLALLATLLSALPLTLESAQRARRDMVTPLVIAGGMTVIKVLLNVTLMFGYFGLPRLELVGAGLASLISQGIAALAYVVVARTSDRPDVALWPSVGSEAGLFAAARESLRVSSSAIGERLAMVVALLAYFAILSQYGPSAIAAYSIGVRVLAFTWLPSVGFGAAAATLVGQALGAGDAGGAFHAGWRATRLALGFTVVLAVVCLLVREPLAHVFTHDAAIIAQLTPFLVMLAVAQPFMGVHFTLAGALRGAGDTLTPLLGASAGNWLLRVPLAWIFARYARLPLAWAWAALIADHMLRCGWYVISFWRGSWAKTGGVRLVVPDG